MAFDIREESAASLDEYARLPMSFEVRAVLEVSAPASGLGGLLLTERRLDIAYVKDYDAIPGEGPRSWPKRFDLSRWRFFLARDGGQLIGGAAMVLDSPEIHLCEGRRDLAVLWDIRVAHPARGQGVGSALFAAVVATSAARGARQLKVETQNINLAACRFYARNGCVLGAIHRHAYPDFSDEAQLLWYKDLSS